ncbi:SOS response-associated peptidase family protein [Bordetella genomosp. 13]|uniref:Uncharacterized protein n=1 Tax=Bordetella genomosp. 13 TaxID=463040 RepID=A0A1W6ZCV8_9BORD|nr:SOS response-associated peptidase family protein [Bordetella genomosp. 13]ARP95226.1 hypothetical protein CAL15_13025 [Bordetella genomosp. 13]
MAHPQTVPTIGCVAHEVDHVYALPNGEPREVAKEIQPARSSTTTGRPLALQLGEIIRQPREWDITDDDGQGRELVPALWGTVAPAVTAATLDRALANTHSFNARPETVDMLPTFRQAWAAGRRCIIQADAIYEPDHRLETKLALRAKGAVPTRFSRAKGEPLALAGLSNTYKDAAVRFQLSYAMLNINAARHPLFRHYHRPDEENRMDVVLPDCTLGDWLMAPVARARELLVPFTAERWTAEPERPGEPHQAALF